LIEAIAGRIEPVLRQAAATGSPRLLFSRTPAQARGRGRRSVPVAGRAYRRGVVARLAISNLDWSLCYQSRVGRSSDRPSTDAEVRRAAPTGCRWSCARSPSSRALRTLVEIEVEYRHMAEQSRSAFFAFPRWVRAGLHKPGRIWSAARCSAGRGFRPAARFPSVRSTAAAPWPVTRERAAERLYPWIKALHLVAVISWMAGLLYLRGCSSTLRRAARLAAVRDFQSHGTAAVARDHEPGDGRDLRARGLLLATPAASMERGLDPPQAVLVAGLTVAHH